MTGSAWKHSIFPIQSMSHDSPPPSSDPVIFTDKPLFTSFKCRNPFRNPFDKKSPRYIVISFPPQDSFSFLFQRERFDFSNEFRIKIFLDKTLKVLYFEFKIQNSFLGLRR
jgi:hypothetical protein